MTLITATAIYPTRTVWKIPRISGLMQPSQGPCDLVPLRTRFIEEEPERPRVPGRNSDSGLSNAEANALIHLPGRLPLSLLASAQGLGQTSASCPPFLLVGPTGPASE